jgi:uncharacterized protein YjbJ (UPF0337 family)
VSRGSSAARIGAQTTAGGVVVVADNPRLASRCRVVPVKTPTVRSHTMAAENKAANKVTEVKGKAKKEAGRALGNQQMEAEGKADEAKGNLKQAGEKVKDAFKK